jgi:hypothetical protein
MVLRLSGQLGQGHGHGPSLPADLHKHVGEQVASGARRRTSIVSPVRSGETALA